MSACQELLARIRKRNLPKILLPILFPLRCPVCERPLPYGQLICPTCRPLLPYTKQPVCYQCGKPIREEERALCYDCRIFPKSFQGGCALFLYENTMKPSVMRFKYHNQRVLSYFYAKELVDRFSDRFERWQIDLIVPVPIHKTKRRQRGYNQASCLARELSRLTDIPWHDQVLLRTINTIPQKQFTPQARLTNIQKAFSLGPPKLQPLIEGKNILLIDDIYTTGATLEACTRILHAAGAADVYVCALCIGVARD